MKKLFLVLALLSWLAVPVFAEDFQVEVLNVQGTAKASQAGGDFVSLKEGDVLKKGAKIEVEKGAEVDLSFDKDWKNILRLETESEAEIDSVSPAKVGLKKGAVFAKLKQLPKDSSFSVETPTALAAVRGTEYRTLFENGQTQVFNVSTSKVSVYGLDAAGHASGEPVILSQSQKTGVVQTGEAPRPAELMSSEVSRKTEEIKSGIQEKVEEAQKSGRVGKIQDVAAIEKSLVSRGATEEAESRVVDTRRRAFKKA